MTSRVRRHDIPQTVNNANRFVIRHHDKHATNGCSEFGFASVQGFCILTTLLDLHQEQVRWALTIMIVFSVLTILS